MIQIHLDTNPIGELFTAPFDAVLSIHDIVVPDLLFLSKARADFLTSKNLQGPPDVVVEILSPGTRRRDRGLKRNLYERVGVDEYWLIDPAEDAVIFHWRGTTGFEHVVRFSEADVLTTPVLPGFELQLNRLFV